ncbi:AbrB/MazE/SpoVT family DNA-binding domain-containing protein [Halobacillus aidingensis]|uniref:Transcriptional pleiotropic regulator of transition state genes n=1 Tax=Halobacillus aidingensis TaxID=240303 RepID=A0A1H0MJB9_HALAD|nr:transcriptional pleiotropic regulator of transition state genes [Halobacillus aidingensis]
MKSTGIVRKVDELGRVVVPIELRRTLGIRERDPVEIFVDDDKVILKKYVTSEDTKEQRDKINKLMKFCDGLKLKAGAAQKEQLEQIQNELYKTMSP